MWWTIFPIAVPGLTSTTTPNWTSRGWADRTDQSAVDAGVVGDSGATLNARSAAQRTRRTATVHVTGMQNCLTMQSPGSGATYQNLAKASSSVLHNVST